MGRDRPILLSTATLVGWRTPRDWFGLWRILDWIPASVAMVVAGIAILFADEKREDEDEPMA